MELGNLVFGNSRGEFEIDRETYPDCIKDGVFENDVFIVRPYYYGMDEKIAALPNFEYKPDGLKICWYKYMMRDAYSNKELTVDYIKEVFNNIKNSLPKLQDIKIEETSDELQRKHSESEMEKIRKNSIYGTFGFGGFHRGGFNNDDRRD